MEAIKNFISKWRCVQCLSEQVDGVACCAARMLLFWSKGACRVRTAVQAGTFSQSHGRQSEHSAQQRAYAGSSVRGVSCWSCSFSTPDCSMSSLRRGRNSTTSASANRRGSKTADRRGVRTIHVHVHASDADTIAARRISVHLLDKTRSYRGLNIFEHFYKNLGGSSCQWRIGLHVVGYTHVVGCTKRRRLQEAI